MEVKSNKKRIQLIFGKDKNTVNILKDSDGYFHVTIEANDKEKQLTRPGEYGFGFVHIVAMENTSEEYSSKINVLNVISEGNVSTLFYEQPKELTKETIDGLYDPNVFISSGMHGDRMQKIQKKFQPEKMVLYKDFGEKSVDDESFKALISDMKTVDEGKKFKFKDSEFNTEEDYATEVYILE